MSLAALFALMVVMAAIPSMSVLLVVTLSAEGGFRRGAAATVGVVAGDVIYITLAFAGVTALANLPGALVALFKMTLGGWLLWQAWALWARSNAAGERDSTAGRAITSAFMAGLLLTLADHKAIIFYLAVLPAFVPLDAATAGDWLSIVLIATLAVGGVKLIYVLLAERALRFTGSTGGRAIKGAAAVLLGLIAVWLMSQGVLALR